MTVIGPVIDGMDLAGVCLTVDALHSLADLGKRVLALSCPTFSGQGILRLFTRLPAFPATRP
jgi:hypothetical protein